MIKVSATKLKNNLFEFLDRVSRGETITVQLNGEDVALITPLQKEDWREKMKTKAKLLVPPAEAFAPLDDI